MRCAGRAYCKLYKDKSQCKKVAERQKDNGICDCRHARYLCEVDDCLFSHVRGTLHCEPKDWVKLYEEYIVRKIISTDIQSQKEHLL